MNLSTITQEAATAFKEEGEVAGAVVEVVGGAVEVEEEGVVEIGTVTPEERGGEGGLRLEGEGGANEAACRVTNNIPGGLEGVGKSIMGEVGEQGEDEVGPSATGVARLILRR